MESVANTPKRAARSCVPSASIWKEPPRSSYEGAEDSAADDDADVKVASPLKAGTMGIAASGAANLDKMFEINSPLLSRRLRIRRFLEFAWHSSMAATKTPTKIVIIK